MSDDYSTGRAGYPPPSGASNSHWAGWHDYQRSMSATKPAANSVTPLSASRAYGPDQANETYIVLVCLEALVFGLITMFHLWDHMPHNLLALLAGAFVWAGYLFLVKMDAAIYWMLIPRMLMWGGLVASFIASIRIRHDDHPDVVWQVFFGAIPAILIFWNAYSSKRKTND